MKRDGRGGTEVSFMITCSEEERRWFEIGAYVAIIEGILISEIKRRRGKSGGEPRKRMGMEWKKLSRWAMPSPDHETMLRLRAGLFFSSPSRFPEAFLAISL